MIERRLNDPPIEILLSFLAPLAAYLLAETVQVSGVLAVVAAGLLVGRRSVRVLTAGTRLQGNTVWDLVIFLLNGLIFVLIGLQLPRVMASLAGWPIGTLLWYGGAVSLTVVVARILWVFVATYLPRLLSRRIREQEPTTTRAGVGIVAYTGLRGVVSLAAALALPLELDNGTPFPQRDLLLFLTCCVILVTLVGQGLTLAPLVRWLDVRANGDEEAEEITARQRGIGAALARLDELAREERAHDGAVGYLRGYYTKRTHLLGARFGLPDHDHDADDHAGHDHGDHEDHVAAHRALLADFQWLQRELLRAEREVVIRLRDEGTIGDETLHRIERDLDFEEIRIQG